MAKNILTVFIASPGDLEPERIAAREIVTDASVVAREVGWTVELRGWEDALPGAGRPQELINADVDECDLFIGLLWQRWGTPTGEHGSGFEEEFVRALDRHSRTGVPEIWLFFKDVPEDRLEDPGDQLRQVMAFRRKRELSQDVLFGTFSRTEQWRARVARDLARLVIRKAQRAPDATVQAQAAKRTPTADVPDGDVVVSQGDDVKQVIKLFERLQAPTRTDSGSHSFDLTDSEAVRLYLFASTFHQARFSGQYPDAHAINVLYLHRAGYRFTTAEKKLLFRSLIVDHNSVVPGWYWFRELDRDLVFDAFRFMGTYEQDCHQRA